MKNNIKNIPLCVDLDGTLLNSDMLFESVLIMLKNNPFLLFLLPFWLFKGKVYLKNNIFSRIEFNPASLPYREEVLDYIKQEKNHNRAIILVTATPQFVAEKISDYLGLFSDVYGSDEKTNLKSDNKKEKLIKLFGEKSFDYMGDTYADLSVWEAANKAIIVSNDKNLIKKAQKSNNNNLLINLEKKNKLKVIIKEIRVYQWVKNVLIFLPVLMAHKLEMQLLIQSLIAFIAFSFTASSVYVTNDLLDLESDRLHPRKKNRPIAAGYLSIPFSIILAISLFLIGFGITFLLPDYNFLLVLICYYIITSLYSIRFKKVVIVDILTLSLLYTIRIIAGGSATGVEISPWLLAFSMFLFLSLAIVKRYTELLVMREQNRTNIKGRGYEVNDIELLNSIGPSSGYIAVLVFALYVNSEQVVKLYNEPMYMWVIAVLFLYWITRVWFLAHRGQMTDDPIVFTVKDKTSWAIGLLIGILVVMAKGLIF